MTKQEIVVADMGGYHNAHLPETASRLFEGGSWKKQRTIVILPSADMISAKVMLANWSLYFPPNQAVVKMLALGDEVGVAYSNAIEACLNNPDLSQFEYIVTIEHDNLAPPDGVVRLIARMEKHLEFSGIGGLYFCKGPGGCAHIWGDVSDPVPNFRPQIPDLNGGLKECYGTSMGFNIFRLSMFKDSRLKRPWFKTLDGSDGAGIGTQDLTFWADARKHGYRCAVDCSVKVGHIDVTGQFGEKGFVW
jgi:hypothetical protein